MPFQNFYPPNTDIATFVLSLIFVLICFKWPKFEKTDWRFLLTIAFIANLLDYLTTWLFINHMGDAYEGNLFMRWLIHKGWLWFTFYKLVVLNAGLTVIALITRKLPLLSCYLWAISIMLFLTAIHNVIELFHFLSPN